eukprot:jgi/Mesvir1/16887/Mv15766-RA.1
MTRPCDRAGPSVPSSGPSGARLKTYFGADISGMEKDDDSVYLANLQPAAKARRNHPGEGRGSGFQASLMDVIAARSAPNAANQKTAELQQEKLRAEAQATRDKYLLEAQRLALDEKRRFEAEQMLRAQERGDRLARKAMAARIAEQERAARLSEVAASQAKDLAMAEVLKTLVDKFK